MKFACAILLASVVLAQTPAEVKPALVEGKVINSVTGEAIRKADLIITTDMMPEGFGDMAAKMGLDTPAEVKPKQPKQTFGATSDASGKFRIEHIAPGDYFFSIKHAGFVDLNYKATGELRAADGLIHLKEGQEVHDLDLRLIPEGAAVGKVVDEDGDPVPNVMVTAAVVDFSSGHRKLQLRDSGMSNDRGEYRLGKLPPGRYYICAERLAMDFMSAVPPPPKDGSPETAYVATYYPKMTDSAEAEAVDVKAGVDVPGLTIQLQKSRVVRVKGIAMSADGKPLKGAQLMLMSAARPGSMRMVMLNDPEGKFEIANVPPGTYTAMIMQLADQKMTHQPLFVPAENLSDVKLGVPVEGSIQGRVSVMGEGKVTLKGMTVGLEGDAESMVMPVNSTADEGGAFVLKKVAPSSYEVQLQAKPAGAYLKSVLWNGKEKLGDHIDFSLGGAADLQIYLGTDGGAFETTVAHDATVVLMPADERKRNPATALSEEAGDDGHVAFHDVPPGDYVAIAWEKIEEGEWFDPAVVKAAGSNAVRVTIGPKEKKQVEMKTIGHE